MVFDITGGVLTAGGLLFAGVTLGFKRRKILSEFTSEIDRGREKFYTEVSESLKKYIATIKERIDRNFNRFDEHLAKEGNDISKYTDELSHLRTEVDRLDKELA